MTSHTPPRGVYDIGLPGDVDAQIRDAVGHFWRTRADQQAAQVAGGQRDRGGRSAVTGGKQMGGFSRLLCSLLQRYLPDECVMVDARLELPGFYRPTKQWDLVVVHEGKLLAAVELKSQVGPSFGNNFNNRVEEAVGSATDILTAYREGAFGISRRPWLGYIFLLEDCDRSRSPVRVSEPHYPVFPEFREASYARRYEELCRRLVREGLYSEAALLLSESRDLDGSRTREPAKDIALRPLLQSLLASVSIAIASG